ncbi:MAG: peptide chain release factor aRF-1 [Candidatus Pacearchaeota archaeon]
MEEQERLKIERLIEELESYRGRHTELITVYIPADYNINLAIKQIDTEKSTAVNIKSKNTRKSVLDALERITRQLKLYKETPKNGLAIFSGNISKTEGQEDIRIWVYEPPVPIKVKMYRCDQTFVLDPLKELLEAKEVYGLVVMDRREATLGVLEGKNIRVLKRMTSGVPGKQRAGGQSAQRFERLTEQMAVDFYRRVTEAMKEQFFNMPKLKGILIGGPGPTKENMLEYGQLVTALKNKIIAIKDIGYTDEFGLRMLVEASQDILAKEEITKEKEEMKKFFTLLATKPEKVSYGEAEVLRALSLGAVEKLFLSKKLKKEKIHELEQKAAEISANVVLVSDETDEGKQFLNLGGIGAILRYTIGE